MAGAPHRFVNLINRYTKHVAKLIIERDFVFKFWCGQKINRDNKNEIPEALSNADILHFHGARNFDRRKILGFNIDHFIKKKPLCLHYHGSPMREHPKQYQRANKPLLVSTPELLHIFRGATFFPNLIDETNRKLYPAKTSKNGALAICHHFSLHTKLKNTGLYSEIQRHYRNNKDIKLGFLTRQPHADANKARALYDIVFDHLQGYYGIISLEAMAQNIGVINGCKKNVMEILTKFLGASPPFIIVDKNNIINEIDRLAKLKANDLGQFKALMNQGGSFVKKHWSGKVLINRLIDFYKTL